MLVHLEPAEFKHSADLAILFDMTFRGFAALQWADMTVDCDTEFETGKMRAGRTGEEGGFSFENATIARIDDFVAGMLLSYVLKDPAQMDQAELSEDLEPILRLEEQVVGSRYINACTVYGEYRQNGVGSLLMNDAITKAKKAGERKLSAIIDQENELGAMLLDKFGFDVTADDGDDYITWQLWTRNI